MNASRSFDVLLVEDSPTDLMLLREAFGESPGVRLHSAVDGEEALAFLRRRGRHAQAPRPALVCLDLNMPRKGGLDVLRELKADPQLCAVPVVILTTSDAESDVLAAYQAHANGYLAKPIDFDAFITMVQVLRAFWLGVAQLPDTKAQGRAA